MDGSSAIENTRTALLRILAGLFKMAGWASAAPDLFGDRKTAPRHVRLAILQILRPAEAATRRLAVALSRSLPPLPQVRLRKLPPKPKQEYFEIPSQLAVRPGQHRTGVILPSNALKRFGPDGTIQAYLIPKPLPTAFIPARWKRDPKRGVRHAAFPLLDPLPNPTRLHRKYAPRHSQPRAWSLDTPRPPTPRPAGPSDRLDATALAHRIATLTDALNDLPTQARRYQRWQMLRAAAKRREALTGIRGRPMRRSPLKPGRPPGGRLARWEPERVYRSRRIREVDEILARAHDLALYALERRDTS